MKEYRGVSVVFYSDDGMIFFQERGGFSKYGEEWGLFGGGLEKGETFEEAALREVKEELHYDLKDFKLHGPFRIEFQRNTGKETYYQRSYIGVVTAKAPPNFENFRVYEGCGIKRFTYKQAKKLKLMHETRYVIEKLKEMVDAFSDS